MTYRDDLVALASRKAALERELADTSQLLDEARAHRRLPVLDRIQVAAPCSVPWDAMAGDDRVRHCDDCKLDVYNLSGMTRDEAEVLIESRIGSLCVRFFRRADGTILTADCPTGLKHRRRRRLLVASMTGVTAGSALAVWATHSEPEVMGATVAISLASEPTTGVAVIPPPPPQVDEKPQEVLGQMVAERPHPVRLTGTEQILPDDATRAAIANKHVKRVVGTWKLCIDERGAVSSAKMLKSTGFARYDRDIGDAVRAWTYSENVPACTAVTFVYKL
jgi:hypothetical protein